MKHKINHRAFLKNTAMASAALQLSAFHLESFDNNQIPAIIFPEREDLKLWYDKPANEWVEALPVGNGRWAAGSINGLRARGGFEFGRILSLTVPLSEAIEILIVRSGIINKLFRFILRLENQLLWMKI